MRYLCMITLALILASCTGNTANVQNAEDSKIIYGLSITVSGIDPHINQSSELGIVLRQVYDTLVYRHPVTRDFVPGLAQSWDISQDSLTYTFYLREDVTFHDGTAFNAAAVASNIDRITNPETNSQRARSLLGPLTGYQVVDDYTIRLILSEPFSPLLDSLAQIYLAMASPTALKEYSLLRYQYYQVGTGPFIFVEYLPEDRIVIRRNPDYAWGPDFYGTPGPQSIQEVEFRFFRDPATRAVALETNQAQVMGELLPLDARSLSNNNAINLEPISIPGQPLQFYMNTQLAPTNNVAIRQALLYATNRPAIVDAVYQGFSPVAWGPLAANTAYYNPGVNGVYSHDPAQTQAILQSLGYEDSDGDGILDRNGEALELRVIQPAWGQVPEVTQLLQDQWRLLGIRVIIEPVPGFTTLIEKVQEGNYNLVSFDTFGMDPVLLNDRFLSDGPVNWTGYSNRDLDTILLQAARTSVDEERRLLYGQAQAIIMQEALILPIRDYVNVNAAAANLEGLIYDPYGWFPLLHDVTVAD